MTLMHVGYMGREHYAVFFDLFNITRDGYYKEKRIKNCLLVLVGSSATI